MLSFNIEKHIIETLKPKHIQYYLLLNTFSLPKELNLIIAYTKLLISDELVTLRKNLSIYTDPFIYKRDLNIVSTARISCPKLDLDAIKKKYINSLQITGFKNCVSLKVVHENINYNVKLYKYGVQVCGVKNIKMIEDIIQLFDLKVVVITLPLINITTKFINKVALIDNPLNLKYNKSSILLYNTGRCLFNVNNNEFKELYHALYCQIDLPFILKLLFQYKTSLFSTLPFDLYQVILQKVDAIVLELEEL